MISVPKSSTSVSTWNILCKFGVNDHPLFGLNALHNGVSMYLVRQVKIGAYLQVHFHPLFLSLSSSWLSIYPMYSQKLCTRVYLQKTGAILLSSSSLESLEEVRTSSSPFSFRAYKFNCSSALWTSFRGIDLLCTSPARLELLWAALLPVWWL